MHTELFQYLFNTGNMRLNKRTREVMNKGWIEHREKQGPAALEHTLVDERKLTEIHAHTNTQKQPILM